MKKKIILVIVGIFALLVMMFAEYRYIMVNQNLYRGENGTIYIEMFSFVDTYYVE